jgi:hypothetical protein
MQKYELIYNGQGFLVGVPSKHLTKAEVKKYGKDWLLASGLYQEYYQPKRKAEEPVEEQL